MLFYHLNLILSNTSYSTPVEPIDILTLYDTLALRVVSFHKLVMNWSSINCFGTVLNLQIMISLLIIS